MLIVPEMQGSLAHFQGGCRLSSPGLSFFDDLNRMSYGSTSKARDIRRRESSFGFADLVVSTQEYLSWAGQTSSFRKAALTSTHRGKAPARSRQRVEHLCGSIP